MTTSGRDPRLDMKVSSLFNLVAIASVVLLAEVDGEFS